MIKKKVLQFRPLVKNIVKNTVPNYARVGQFVRGMRMSPFGNFMSWPSEIFRTGFGIFRQGLKDKEGFVLVCLCVFADGEEGLGKEICTKVLPKFVGQY